MAGQPTKLTEELVEIASGYLATCVDGYRRYDEVKETEDQESAEDSEDLYSDARAFVREQGQATVSGLQRHLKLGYAKAARLMDLLEEHKVIGEAQGPAPRELLPEEEEIAYDGSLSEHDAVERAKRKEWVVQHTRLNVNLPSIAGLAVYLKVSRDSIYAWRDTDSELGKRFSDILSEILAEQEKRLINGGISGTYNPMITKLALGKHGYSDKTDLTSGGKELQPTPEHTALANAALAHILKPKE